MTMTQTANKYAVPKYIVTAGTEHPFYFSAAIDGKSFGTDNYDEAKSKFEEWGNRKDKAILSLFDNESNRLVLQKVTGNREL